MSEREIRDAGLAIDVPFETGDGRERLKYADLGPDKKWTPPAAKKESPSPTPEKESS